jgi:hypothetical protein
LERWVCGTCLLFTAGFHVPVSDLYASWCDMREMSLAWDATEALE